MALPRSFLEILEAQRQELLTAFASAQVPGATGAKLYRWWRHQLIRLRRSLGTFTPTWNWQGKAQSFADVTVNLLDAQIAPMEGDGAKLDYPVDSLIGFLRELVATKVDDFRVQAQAAGDEPLGLPRDHSVLAPSTDTPAPEARPGTSPHVPPAPALPPVAAPQGAGSGFGLLLLAGGAYLLVSGKVKLPKLW